MAKSLNGPAMLGSSIAPSAEQVAINLSYGGPYNGVQGTVGSSIGQTVQPVRVRVERPEDWVPAEDASVYCDNRCDEISADPYPVDRNGVIQFLFFFLLPRLRSMFYTFCCIQLIDLFLGTYLVKL